MASHRDLHGAELPASIAAVELLNLLRATVAVARFIVFAAVALREHGGSRRRIAAGDAEHLACFVQEVRRTTPFFPFIGGRVRKPFEWGGHAFAEGDWVLLDLYGTDRDPRSWHDPHVFRPERYRTERPDAFNFVPQGAGDAVTTHRCPGEEIANRLIETAVHLLSTMKYEVPDQDLSVDLARIPALPRSGFVMTRIRRVEPSDTPAQHAGASLETPAPHLSGSTTHG
jgi:fatty-acid peroxygenase